MGQQQLLLLVLSTIIVGVSIVVGIGMFQDSAMNSNIDTVTQENVTIASKASEWFNKDAALGGGAGSFVNCDLQKLGYTSDPDTSNIGVFEITAAAGVNLTVTGKTDEVDDKGKKRLVTTTVVMDAATGQATVVSAITVL